MLLDVCILLSDYQSMPVHITGQPPQINDKCFLDWWCCGLYEIHHQEVSPCLAVLSHLDLQCCLQLAINLVDAMALGI